MQKNIITFLYIFLNVNKLEWWNIWTMFTVHKLFIFFRIHIYTKDSEITFSVHAACLFLTRYMKRATVLYACIWIKCYWIITNYLKCVTWQDVHLMFSGSQDFFVVVLEGNPCDLAKSICFLHDNNSQ